MSSEEARLAVVALFVAAGSLFVAGASLVWQIVHALRVDTARLRCEVGAFIAPKSYESGTWEVVTVTATNVGKRTTRLTGLWLVVGKPPRWWLRRLPGKLRAKVMPTQGLLIPPLPDNSDWEMAYYSTAVPTDLGEGGTASIHYKNEMVMKYLTERSERFVYGVASATTASARSKRARLG